MQYNMTTLLDYIAARLVKDLHKSFTLDASSLLGPTCVFKWLKTADELQLADLHNACIDALGTYLLPAVPQHAGTFNQVVLP